MLMGFGGARCVFFFFKQKTAYEMRISDWSSDVCSSDLVLAGGGPSPSRRLMPRRCRRGPRCAAWAAASGRSPAAPGRPVAARRRDRAGSRQGVRSEENTSELQSLMRISYDVVCLKQKTKKDKEKNRDTRQQLNKK